MCPTAKLRGAAMGTRVEDESVEPRPLERRVGRVDGATTPGPRALALRTLTSGAMRGVPLLRPTDLALGL